MKIPLVDLGAQHATLSDELEGALRRVVQSGRFILGTEVEAFEAAAAARLGVEHAIGVSSGSDALLMALSALGIGPGDEVVTTPFTFFATIEAILRVGAVPRFADIDARTFNVDAASMDRVIGKRTRALLIVHLFGRPAPLEDLVALANRHGLALVEDAAQAFGVRHLGRSVGTWGSFGCFSFFPSKPLGALGDAGMLVTNDDWLADRCRKMRQHGATSAHHHAEAGGNFRLDALQAAVLSAKLPHLDAWLERRRAHAAAYDDALRSVRQVALPAEAPPEERASAVYAIRVPAGRRGDLITFLRRQGIETAIYYPKPAHLQPALRHLETGTLLPNAERAASEVLSLPLYPELLPEQIRFVAARIREFFAGV